MALFGHQLIVFNSFSLTEAALMRARPPIRDQIAVPSWTSLFLSHHHIGNDELVPIVQEILQLVRVDLHIN